MHDREDAGAGMRHDEFHVGIAREDAVDDHSGDAELRLEEKAEHQREVVVGQVLGEGGEVRMLDHRQLVAVDARPDRFEPLVGERHAVDVRADRDAADLFDRGHALEFDERGRNVVERQGGEHPEPVGIAARAVERLVIGDARGFGLHLLGEEVEIRRGEREERHVDAALVHFLEVMGRPEPVRPGRDEKLAVLEDAVAIGGRGGCHAGKLVDGVVKVAADDVGVYVDLHGRSPVCVTKRADLAIRPHFLDFGVLSD